MEIRFSKQIFVGYVLVFYAFFCVSCADKSASNKKYMTKKELENHEKSLEMANKYLTVLDAERIANYAKRRNWNMTESKTGIWYEIYEKGNGSKTKKGQVAVFKYRISLLDGTVCYTSDSLGVKKMEIGHGGVESGLEEGILLLHKGDKARFILPPFRAHGLLGDRKHIPARSIIVYELELIDLISKASN